MGAVTAWDLEVLHFITEHMRIDLLSPVMKFITSLGDAGAVWIALAVLFLILRRTRRTGFAMALALVICLLVTNLTIKPLAARIRPYDLDRTIMLLIAPPSDYSFPSGHAAASFSCAFAMVFAGSKKSGIAALCLACVIGFSRLYVGVHYPTDVMGGILIGLAISALAAWLTSLIYPRLEKRFSKKGSVVETSPDDPA